MKAVYDPFMDLKHMMYMLMYVYVRMQSQRTLAVKEEVCKGSPVVKGVEVMISHEMAPRWGSGTRSGPCSTSRQGSRRTPLAAGWRLSPAAAREVHRCRC